MNLNDTNKLATYNAERSRGIVHTAECKEAMKLLQIEYNKELHRKYLESLSTMLNDNEKE